MFYSEGILTFFQGKRVFIKDIDHYLFPPAGKPASIAPSLRRIKRGVGTTSDGHVQLSAEGVDDVRNDTVDVNGHSTVPSNGAASYANGTTNGAVTDGTTVNGANCANGHTNGHTSNNGTNGVTKPPYPYDTPAEPGNPTVMPRDLQQQFHFTFLIRDPHYSVPSYYRCTIPPLDEVTGFHNYDPREAGYDELRRHFDYLRQEGLVGPRVATRPELYQVGTSVDPTVQEICVVDADDMLDAPAPTIEAFCRSVGLPYSPAMLQWDTKEDYQFACAAFEKWRGFHNDAIESKGLEARQHVSLARV